MRAGIVINGRFVTHRTTGVQRYAREMVHALDELDIPDVALELICPPGAVEPGSKSLSGVGAPPAELGVSVDSLAHSFVTR